MAPARVRCPLCYSPCGQQRGIEKAQGGSLAQTWLWVPIRVGGNLALRRGRSQLAGCPSQSSKTERTEFPKSQSLAGEGVLCGTREAVSG